MHNPAQQSQPGTNRVHTPPDMPHPATPRPVSPLTGRGHYQRWISIPIRFADQDPVGHVNNAAIAVYFEQARCELLLPLIAEHGAGALDIVLARIEIDYLREIRYPGTVEVGIRISRLGSKSITLESAVFAENICRATAVATIVVFDLATRASTVPPPALRAALEVQMRAADSGSS